MLDNKLGRTFEQLSEEELQQINAGAGWTVTVATSPSSAPCLISGGVSLSVTAAVSYFVTR
ncbi:hypothetical protein CAC02_07950 [Streptococcus gallolyticus]|uniref:Uncharacterized protein n=1 Tax=Streptococcus gallolyticus TaxID=315405 RepID=A0A368UC41_9STRE|nr:hypothetical protein CAC02_07950 [Streptococcus gallolyticus]